jgi:hypothetical protein
MGSATDWHALLDDFRNFGGKAENVMQRKGAFGMGLFSIDTSKPIDIQVPDQLLVDTDNVELRDGEIVIKDPSIYPDGYADWFLRYQNEYSWGEEGRQNILDFENGLKSLPDDIQLILKRTGLYNSEIRFPEKDTEKEIFQRFLMTRCIRRQGNRVIMPIIELINHSSSASSYDVSGDGIAVNGLFEGEILAKYSNSDPIHRFFNYGFNVVEPFGFSLNTRLVHRNQKILVRGGGSNKGWGNPPSVEKNKDILIIQFPLLASLKAPKMPRTLFIKAFQKFDDIDANELFDQIHQQNTELLVNLINTLLPINSDIAERLQKACLDQIIALSHRIGIREDLLNQDANAGESA